MKGILSFEARRKFANLNQDLLEFWKNGSYGSSKNVGNLKYLVIKAHKQLGKKMTRGEFGNFYLDSGRSRNEELEKRPLNQFNLDLYRGRTMKDISELSRIFVDDFNSKEIRDISLAHGENVAFIMIFDETYFYYERLLLCLAEISRRETNKLVELAGTELLDVGVDIVVSQEGGGLVEAYSLEGFYQDNSTLEEKHKLFTDLYGIEPIRL